MLVAMDCEDSHHPPIIPKVTDWLEIFIAKHEHDWEAHLTLGPVHESPGYTPVAFLFDCELWTQLTA